MSEQSPFIVCSIRFRPFSGPGWVEAAAFQVAADPTSQVPMVGASGAIGGVMGAYIYISLSPWQNEGIERGLFMYGIFSAYAFLVNFFLGARYLFDKEDTTLATTPTFKQKMYRFIKKSSLLTYVLSCTVNWLWQLKYFIYLIGYKYSLERLSRYTIIDTGLLSFYIIMIYSWINDDIVLMKYLSK